MSLYSNQLAPWERRREYYESIQLGKDVKTQTELISKSTKAMIAAQLTSTNALISSQERISEGIDNLSYGIDRVEQGIAGLQAAFEWGISEVVWQLEQNRTVLKSILEVLSAPLDTQAKELRKRAEEAYANGWFEDAMEDFLESEKKNRYDFSIHISIGMIYLFQKADKQKALEYFDKAIKYAKPKSNYHTSFALLHKGLIKRDLGLVDEAEKCAAEAVALCPGFAEAIYQNAQYAALLNNPDKSVDLLQKAIELDVNYCEKTCAERDFEAIKPRITDLFVRLRDKEAAKARAASARISRKMEQLDSLLSEIKSQEPIKIEDAEVRKCLSRIEELMRRNSYRDYLEANRLIDGFGSLFNKTRTDLKTQLEKAIGSYRSSIYGLKDDKEKQTTKFIDNLDYLIWGIPVSIFLGIRSCYQVQISNPLHGLWEFITITFWGIVITVVTIMLFKAILKSEGEEEPIGVNIFKSKISRIEKFLHDLNETQE